MKILLALCFLVLAVSSHAANIAFISLHGAENMPSTNATNVGFTMAPDTGYTQLLTANGHTVTRFVSVDNFNVSALNSADLVVISRSVASAHYQATNETAAWNGLTKPVIFLNAYVLRGGTPGGNVRLGLMAGNTIPDVTNSSVRLRVLAPSHPVFANIPLDPNGVMVNAYADRVTHTNFLQRGVSVITGATAGGGVILGVVGTANDPATGGAIIAEWLPGAVLSTAGRGGGATNDVLGGHRLMILTGSRESAGLPADAAGIFDLSTDGAQLLLNAVNYMTSGRSSIRTVNTVNNETPGAGETSLRQALSDLRDGDYVRFNIPGPGPHAIVTPIGGYPLITNHGVIIDGYTQPGSVPNSNPILGGNNAQIKIVLDSTGTETLPNPDPNLPNRPLRRSTRLDFPTLVGNTGYGDSENCILGVFEADNVTIRGLSFLARPTASNEDDPSIYCVALVKQATNAHVNGCYFGIPPAGSPAGEVRPAAAAVAAFRWRIGGDVYSGGFTGGTDGDGFNDRAEFNVCIGSRINYALELPGARISGIYLNVFPNGNTFADIDALYAQQVAVAGGGTVEFFENGRVAHNTIIGTDGDGISDSDERNICGHTVYNVSIEFYSAATNVVIAGNYFGVGVNGTSAAPLSTNINPNFLALPGTASARIGSNGDGVSDALEGNLIVNTRGGQFVPLNASIPVVQRGNRLVNCRYGGLSSDPSQGVPIVTITNGVLSGSFMLPAAEYVASFIDVYTLDAAALSNDLYYPTPIRHPSLQVLSFADNGPSDLDPVAGQFTIAAPSTPGFAYFAVAVTHSRQAAASNAGQAITGPMSGPVSAVPRLQIRIVSSGGVDVAQLSWLGADNAFVVEQNPDFGNPDGWLDFPMHTYHTGRNITEIPYDAFPFAKYFFRLRSQ